MTEIDFSTYETQEELRTSNTIYLSAIRDKKNYKTRSIWITRNDQDQIENRQHRKADGGWYMKQINRYSRQHKMHTNTDGRQHMKQINRDMMQHERTQTQMEDNTWSRSTEYEATQENTNTDGGQHMKQIDRVWGNTREHKQRWRTTHEADQQRYEATQENTNTDGG